MTAALVALGGALGAAARYLAERAGARRWGEPWGTFAVNVSGSFLLGLLVGLDVGERVTTVLGVGVLGSYTTFSAYAVQVARGARLYACLSVLGGVLAAGLGLGLGFRLGG
ncbi:MAG TPA: CrcB family protein [Mycobacteriales bacterium]|jgi:CrcB protein